MVLSLLGGPGRLGLPMPRGLTPLPGPPALAPPTLWELTLAQAWDLARAVGVDFVAEEMVVAVPEAAEEVEAHADTYAGMLAASLVSELWGPACLWITLSVIASSLPLDEALSALLHGPLVDVGGLFAPVAAAAAPLTTAAGALAGALADPSRFASPEALSRVFAATGDAATGAASTLGAAADVASSLRWLSFAATSAAAAGAASTLGAAADVASSLRWLSFPSEAAAAAAAGESLRNGIGSAYVLLESSFYVACMSYAATVSTFQQDFGFTPERRKLLWRRILDDASVSPQELARAWFYDEGGLSEDYGIDRSVSILADYLAANAARKAGALLRDEPATQPAAAPPTRAGGGGGRGRRPSHVADAERVKTLPAFSALSRGDVKGWLARNLFYKEVARLSALEAVELDGLVDELEASAGEKLRPTDAPTPGLRSMCAGTDAVRWRHRPLWYYFITQGVGKNVWTPAVMAAAGYERRTQEELVYWYRPAQPTGAPATAPPSQQEAFVFIHGVGVGPAPYAQFLEAAAPDRAAAVIAVELSAPAQRIFPDAPPPPERFARLVADAMDSVGIERAVVGGHSLGTAYASYVASADARGELARRGGSEAAASAAGSAPSAKSRRISGLVLIDPIACLLHQSRVTNQFVYTPASSLKEAADDYYFKKELFTATVIARQLPWHDAAVWLDERTPQTPTLVALSSQDSIVPAVNVQSVFGSWQASWPLQLRANHPFVAPPHLHCPPWCNSIARLLLPLRPPVCMPYTIQ